MFTGVRATRGSMCITAVLWVLAAGAARGHQEQSIDVFPVPTPGSRPYTITAGPDGCLYLTESKGDRIARITTDGVITEFLIPTPNCGAYGIATGSDGRIWFTERFADQIGAFDPVTQEFEEHPVPTSFAQPWEIAAGPDGNLWFTEEDVNQIGKAFIGGGIVEFDAGCCFPTGITSGADGNLWYTIEIGDQIGRMATNGQGTLFPIQTDTQLLLWDITPGPDGNVWFTELAGRAIGRISPSGDLKQFPIEGDFSGIAGITAGPDGRLWFTENDTSRIGSITAKGKVRLQQNIDADTRPLCITLGPDGNLWFTMADGNGIGRVHRARGSTVYVLSMDAGFSPSAREAQMGKKVQWTFVGPREHSVVDSSGLGLFDSGARSVVSYATIDLPYAGTFHYHDGGFPSRSGQIDVPMNAPRSGLVGQPIAVTWATQPPGPGQVFDVQVKVSDAGGFTDWQTGTVQTGGEFVPSQVGMCRFRSRVRDAGSGAATDYSPPAQVRVFE